MLAPGTKAPDFRLRDQRGEWVSLGDFAGRKLVIAFYPADFSGVCADQMALYQEILPELNEAGADLVGVSVDSTFAHQAFAEHLGLTMPLLSDFHPKGQVASAYGAYVEERGHAARALFLIDQDGVLTWSYLSPPVEVPGANLIFDALVREADAA